MLNNWIVAKSSCLWHVKGDEKHQCISWVPELVGLLNKKKIRVGPYLLPPYLRSAFLFSARCNLRHFHYTALSFLSPILSVPSNSYGQDLALGERNSCAEPTIAFSICKRQGRGNRAGCTCQKTPLSPASPSLRAEQLPQFWARREWGCHSKSLHWQGSFSSSPNTELQS